MNPTDITTTLADFNRRETLRFRMDIQRQLICDTLLKTPEDKDRIDLYLDELRRLSVELEALQ